MQTSNSNLTYDIGNSNQNQIFSKINKLLITKLRQGEPLDTFDFAELDRLGVLDPQQFEAEFLETENDN